MKKFTAQTNGMKAYQIYSTEYGWTFEASSKYYVTARGAADAATEHVKILVALLDAQKQDAYRCDESSCYIGEGKKSIVTHLPMF